jgi:hypothetical protein
MSEVKDTLFRYLAILQLIPRLPGRISTPSLQEKLKDRGFEIGVRSLQRDLRDKLSIPFSIICHEDERPFRWSLDANKICESLPPSIIDAPIPISTPASPCLAAIDHWKR